MVGHGSNDIGTFKVTGVLKDVVANSAYLEIYRIYDDYEAQDPSDDEATASGDEMDRNGGTEGKDKAYDLDDYDWMMPYNPDADWKNITKIKLIVDLLQVSNLWLVEENTDSSA